MSGALPDFWQTAQPERKTHEVRPIKRRVFMQI
jgi:hypothetical protein